MTSCTRAAGAVLAALACAGCATRSLSEQSFVRLETRDFEIVSSLGASETRELAEDLELLEAGMRVALGLPADGERSTRIRVYAFDDRSLSRPFLKENAKAYFLSTADGPVLVFRGGAGPREDLPVALRHRWAHELLRDRPGERRPLWYEEGLARLASTAELHDDAVRVGRARTRDLARLRDWNPHSLDATLGAEDRSGWGARQNAAFDAEAWLLAHYLRMQALGRPSGRDPLSDYRRRLDAGQSLPQAARAAFGADGAQLADRLNDYAARDQLPGFEYRSEASRSAAVADPQPLTPEQGWIELGELALALGRPELAARYFEDASGRGADASRPHSGLALAARSQGRFDDALRHHERAVALDPDDARGWRELGATQLARAEQSDVGRERERLLDLARRRLEHSLALDPNSAETLGLLAAIHAHEGRDAERGLHYVASARERRPASLELQLIEARLRARKGEVERARRGAVDVFSRSHREETRAAAAALLETLNAVPAP